jgi:hypothetical protein
MDEDDKRKSDDGGRWSLTRRVAWGGDEDANAAIKGGDKQSAVTRRPSPVVKSLIVAVEVVDIERKIKNSRDVWNMGGDLKEGRGR